MWVFAFVSGWIRTLGKKRDVDLLDRSRKGTHRTKSSPLSVDKELLFVEKVRKKVKNRGKSEEKVNA